MIDGSEKRRRQLAFKLQSQRVFEKRNKKTSKVSSSTVFLSVHVLSYSTLKRIRWPDSSL